MGTLGIGWTVSQWGIASDRPNWSSKPPVWMSLQVGSSVVASLVVMEDGADREVDAEGV